MSSVRRNMSKDKRFTIRGIVHEHSPYICKYYDYENTMECNNIEQLKMVPLCDHLDLIDELIVYKCESIIDVIKVIHSIPYLIKVTIYIHKTKSLTTEESDQFIDACIQQPFLSKICITGKVQSLKMLERFHETKLNKLKFNEVILNGNDMTAKIDQSFYFQIGSNAKNNFMAIDQIKILSLCEKGSISDLIFSRFLDLLQACPIVQCVHITVHSITNKQIEQFANILCELPNIKQFQLILNDKLKASYLAEQFKDSYLTKFDYQDDSYSAYNCVQLPTIFDRTFRTIHSKTKSAMKR